MNVKSTAIYSTNPVERKRSAVFLIKIRWSFLLIVVGCFLGSCFAVENAAATLPQMESSDSFARFLNRRAAYFSRVFSSELSRTPPDQEGLTGFIARYSKEVDGSGRINFGSGFFPVVSQNILLSLYKEAEALKNKGSNHPLLYFCQLSILRKIGSETFGQNPTMARKKAAEAGMAVAAEAPPMIRYEFLRELYWRAGSPEKEKRIREIAALLPELVKNTEIRSGEKGVLLEHLSREVFDEGFSVSHRRLLADSLAAATDVNEIFKVFADGSVHIDEAWQSRGSGWSYKVTTSGRTAFQSNLAEARESLEKAWALDPSLPEAAASMITVSMGEGASPEEKTLWFDRSISARCDYYRAYHNYLYASTPRWGGSPNGFIKVILQSSLNRRFDTIIPWQTIDALGWINNELRFPDYLPEQFAKILSYTQSGYAAETNLCVEDREALTTVLAALLVKTKNPAQAHHILSDQDYRINPLYAAHNYGMDTYDFVWQAWYSAPEIEPLHATWIESEQSGDMEAINKLYPLLLEKAGKSMELRQRVHLDRALIDFKNQLKSGDWVDIYTPQMKSAWVDKELYWMPDSLGGFKANVKRSLGWIPVEVNFYEGFEIEVEAQSLQPTAKQRVCIFFGRPEWNKLYMPQVQMRYGENKIEYISGRNEQMDITANQVPIKFSGEDRIRIRARDGNVTIFLNDEEVLSGRIHSGERYAKSLWIGLGDDYDGFYNEKNIYHRIRVREPLR